MLIPRQHWCASVLHFTKDKQCGKTLKAMQTWFQDLIYEVFLKTIIFAYLMPSQEQISHYISAKWRFPVKWEEIMSNITATGENNRWEMQSISHYPCCIKIHPPGRREKKIARVLLCTHLPWPHSQDLKTCLYTWLLVACEPLWVGCVCW